MVCCLAQDYDGKACSYETVILSERSESKDLLANDAALKSEAALHMCLAFWYFHLFEFEIAAF